MKAQDLTGGVYVLIECWTAGYGSFLGNISSNLQLGTFDYWKFVSIPVTSLPEGTGAIKVTVQRLNGTGTVWVDDVRCEEGVSRKEDKSYYYHCDYLGSPRVMTDQLGNVIWRQDYYAFGGDYNTTATGNTHKFTGHVKDDATGQYYAKARYFTTGLGRWSQPEPLLKGVPSKGFLMNPQMLNPYIYCLNNPLKYKDPNGFMFEKIWNDRNKIEAIHPNTKPITYQEFIAWTGQKNMRELTSESWSGQWNEIKSITGPDKVYRYVKDPFDNKAIIDMRHFLVVGQVGEFAGLMYECIQKLSDKKSAFDDQDFYSNFLGTDFINNYFLVYTNLSLQEVLLKYFKDRENKGEGKDVKNDEKRDGRPGGTRYYDMLRDNYRQK